MTVPAGLAPHDVFIFRVQNPKLEIHLPDFGGTANMDQNRTAEVTWRTGQPAQILGAATPNRRCFLTNIITSNAYPSYGGAGFKQASDYVRVYRSGGNWVINGGQSGMVWAKARCIDVNQEVGSYLVQAADPGTQIDLLTSDTTANCFLTGIGGDLDGWDWYDGSVIYVHGSFYMQSMNGKRGWAMCVK